MAFTKKLVVVKFTLSPITDVAGGATTQPTFAGSDANSVTLEGYRTAAIIRKAGGASQGEAQLRVYGMSLDLMNQLSTLGRTPIIIGRNEIEISAGDSESGVALVFRGTINQAYTDLGGAPEGIFIVDAYSMLYQAVQSIPPTSFNGSVSAASMLQGLATQMGMTFENNGVDVILPTPYYSGSAKTQAEAIVHDAGIEWNACDNGILAIWPRGGSRGGSVPLISPDTGMVGYPFPSGEGLIGVRTVFNPQINFGAQVQIQSSVKPACGNWRVVSLTHEISSELPGGDWFSTVIGSPPNYVPRIV